MNILERAKGVGCMRTITYFGLESATAQELLVCIVCASGQPPPKTRQTIPNGSELLGQETRIFTEFRSKDSNEIDMETINDRFRILWGQLKMTSLLMSCPKFGPKIAQIEDPEKKQKSGNNYYNRLVTASVRNRLDQTDLRRNFATQPE
jgi:hypothetical protein